MSSTWHKCPYCNEYVREEDIIKRKILGDEWEPEEEYLVCPNCGVQHETDEFEEAEMDVVIGELQRTQTDLFNLESKLKSDASACKR